MPKGLDKLGLGLDKLGLGMDKLDLKGRTRKVSRPG